VHDESQFSPRLRVDLVIDPIPLGNRQRITDREISNLLEKSPKLTYECAIVAENNRVSDYCGKPFIKKFFK
jgi:hypothetical protein